MQKSPEKTLRIIFNGQALQVPVGISVAAAVLGHAHARHFCHNSVDGSPRAPFCLMGVCHECMMEIDGRPNVQACLKEVKEGMVVRTQCDVEAD